MISDAIPIGVSRSAKKSTAFEPGSRQPMTMHQKSSRRPILSVPPRHITTPAISAPAAMNRVETASSGGIVSPATAIARYVDPQMM